MPSTQADIFLIAADFDLRAFGDRITAGIKAQGHRRLAAAPAEGSNLAHIICNSEEGRAAGEEITFEIGAQAVTHDGNFGVIRDAGEGPDLLGR